MTAIQETLKAPFPWFGGKRRVADMVWEKFGNVPNYVEPFAGSLAVLLGRPHEPRIETVNDKDGFICNFWRSLAKDPDGVAHHCDWPVNEADLHARHRWLHSQHDFLERMDNDPDVYDVKVAGWWVWGISAWIGDNWCRVTRQESLPHMGDGNVVHRESLSNQIPHMGGGMGVHRESLSNQIPHMGGGNGVGWKRPVLQDRGIHCHSDALAAYLHRLSQRLRRVRVCCGDWARICTDTPTIHVGLTGVFLDPPYAAERDNVYNHDSFSLAHDVRAWCAARGDHPKLRIALCGYEGEHNDLEGLGWEKVAWKAQGGYGNQSGNDNCRLERIWFSPHCINTDSHENGSLF